MKRKKKRMSTTTRVLLCSWCVLVLVLTFFVINWARKLPDKNEVANAGIVDAFADAIQEITPTPPVSVTEGAPTPGVTQEVIPQVQFVTEYAHAGEMTEAYGYTERVAYGLRYPLREDAATADAVCDAAHTLLTEIIADLLKEEGTDRTLLIDYEDGETAGIFSVLFHIEKEIDGVKTTETRPWLYNKKKAETIEASALFADRAYSYVAQQVNALVAEPDEGDSDETREEKELFVGNRQEFSEFVLTAEGAKFYYENGEKRQSVVIPYIALHTYMAVTENGTVVADEIRELDPDKPMIALTFDDGPHYEQTPRLLEILEKNGARATFFVLGDRVHWGPSNEQTLKQVYESGNEVASHTHAHKDLKTLSLEKLTEEIVNARNAIFSITGEYPTFVRPPYGSYNDLVKEYSYAPLITWNLDSKDWDFRNSEQVIAHVLEEAKDGKIVLMHDIHWFTVDAAEILIPELIARGYQVVTIRELFYYKNVELENGKVYHSSYN